MTSKSPAKAKRKNPKVTVAAPCTGAVTLPAEVGEEKMVVRLAKKWGADAIRDSDGTELSQDMLDLGLAVYSTTCLVRAEQDYPRRHLDQLPQKYLMSATVPARLQKQHFITADLDGPADFGTHETFVYCCDPATQLLAANGLHVMAAAKSYGQGRSAFFGALPYNLANARLLHRAIFWAAGQERELKKWFCTNPQTDCAYYPATQKWVVVNHSGQPQTTWVYTGSGQTTTVALKPYESVWN